MRPRWACSRLFAFSLPQQELALHTRVARDKGHAGVQKSPDLRTLGAQCGFPHAATRIHPPALPSPPLPLRGAVPTFPPVPALSSFMAGSKELAPCAHQAVSPGKIAGAPSQWAASVLGHGGGNQTPGKQSSVAPCACARCCLCPPMVPPPGAPEGSALLGREEAWGVRLVSLQVLTAARVTVTMPHEGKFCVMQSSRTLKCSRTAVNRCICH